MSVDIDRIKALHEAATKGPWEPIRYVKWWPRDSTAWYLLSETDDGRIPVAGDVGDEANAAFIAAARTDLPACVAEVERLRAEVERLQRLCGYMDPNYGVGSTVDKLRSRIADLDSRHIKASKERNEAREEAERLRVALRDAIRRPMGVVPESATGLIDECGEVPNADER